MMRIGLDSNVATSGRLVVQGPDGTTVVDQTVQVPQGNEQLDVVLPVAAQGFNRYVVRLETPNDARTENNAAEAYTFVRGLPRALLVESTPGDATNLANALKDMVSGALPNTRRRIICFRRGEYRSRFLTFDELSRQNLPRRWPRRRVD